MNGVATIDRIRSAIRALHDALGDKGLPNQRYNLNVGISFPPAQRIQADEVKDAVEKNKSVSPNLHYNIQATLGHEPALGVDCEEAKTKLRKFEQELAQLPQDIGARMVLDFVVESTHEKEIIEDAQAKLDAAQKLAENQEAATKGIAAAATKPTIVPG